MNDTEKITRWIDETQRNNSVASDQVRHETLDAAFAALRIAVAQINAIRANNGRLLWPAICLRAIAEALASGSEEPPARREGKP
jgi:hypothetical protein